mmetsp:Transcript_1497/g.3638  ORF Transcript_1497/g.3638 Transcript_1497/m.3638 type:complete len:290 (+) Transcript_1497:225-1094(+)
MVASVVAAAAWPGLPLQELREYAAAPSRRRQPTTLAFGNVGTRLPLLQFSHDVALQRFAKGTARFAGRSRRLARTSACKSEGAEDIPQEVVDAEERSASGRNYRLAAFAAFGGLGAALTLTRIALNVTATPITNDFLQPSLFGELLDIIVVGTAGILWNSELSTKEENIQRIWDELKRRRAESGPQYVGKDDLRKRKKDKKGGQKRTKGFSQGGRPCALWDHLQSRKFYPAILTHAGSTLCSEHPSIHPGGRRDEGNAHGAAPGACCQKRRGRHRGEATQGHSSDGETR